MHLNLPPTWYRMRLLLDIIQIFIVPSLLVHQTLSHCQIGLRLPWLTKPLYYALAIVLYGKTKNLISNCRHEWRAKRMGAQLIPRVRGRWPGNVDVLLRMMRAFREAYVMDVYLQLFREYGTTTLNLRILWTDQIITMDEEHMKFVLSTGFEHFWRGKAQKERMEEWLGDGIFNRDDEIWKMHRANARPFFARDRISDLHIFEKHTLLTLSHVSDFASTKTAFDAQDLFSRFALDAASEFLFSSSSNPLSLNTLSATFPKAGQAEVGFKGSKTNDDWGEFAQAFEEAQTVVTERARLGYYFWPIKELFGSRMGRPARNVKAWVEPLVRRAVKEKVDRRHQENAQLKDGREKAGGGLNGLKGGEKTFIEHLAASTEDVGLIRDELTSMLLASKDTTSTALTFILYFLAMHPSVLKRLRQEVLESFGTQSVPTLEGLRAMKYMRAVINETLRLFPPVPLNVRQSRSESCVLPTPRRFTESSINTSTLSTMATRTSKSSLSISPSSSKPLTPAHLTPLYMPKNTVVMYFPLLMQRNPALWGDDADVFDPERFLDPERLARLTRNPLMFTPFSAGPRICVGQTFAFTMMSFFLARLLQRFDAFSLAPDAQPTGSLPPVQWKGGEGRMRVEQCWPSYALTLHVKGGLWVRCREARGEDSS